MSRALRIAWFSPLLGRNGQVSPGASESVAAYATEQYLPQLKGKFEIELFHQYFWSHPDFPTYHYLSATTRHREKPFDLFLYHLEDAAVTNFARVHLGLVPGVVIFHDLFLSTHGPEPILNSPWQENVARLRDPRRAWLAHDHEYEASGPLAYRESSLAALALCTNERNVSEFRRHVTQTVRADGKPCAYFLPLPVPALAPAERGTQRTVVFAGTPRIEHRAHKLLAALKTLAAESPLTLTWLISERERAAAVDLLREFETEATLVADRSPQRWIEVTERADVAIHSLFSAYGQPDPYLAISLMRGLPSLVTNFAAAEFLPDAAVYKVQPGETEAAEMTAAIRMMLADPARIGAVGRAFAVERYGSAAQELCAVLHAQAGSISDTMRCWSALQSDAQRELLNESKLLWGADQFSAHSWSESALPVFREFGWSAA